MTIKNETIKNETIENETIKNEQIKNISLQSFALYNEKGHNIGCIRSQQIKSFSEELAKFLVKQNKCLHLLSRSQ